MVNIGAGSSDSLFELNGKNYRKGIYEIYYVMEPDGESHLIGIRNVYNCETLLSPIKPSDFVIDGADFEDTSDGIGLLTASLSDYLGFNTGGGGSSDSGIRTITTSQSDYYLDNQISTTILTFNGISSTLHLPSKSQTKDLIIILTNAGSGILTVTSPDGIWEGGMNMPSTTLNIGTTARVVNDGLEYRINS